MLEEKIKFLKGSGYPDTLINKGLKDYSGIMILSEDKIKMRVSKASAELATAPLFDVIIVNKELGKAQKKAFDLIADFIKK